MTGSEHEQGEPGESGLPDDLKGVEVISVDEYRAWFRMPEPNLQSTVQRTLRQILAGLVNKALDESLVASLGTALSQNDDRCCRDCPPKKPAPVRREMHTSGVYLVCTHNPRHAVRIHVGGQDG